MFRFAPDTAPANSFLETSICILQPEGSAPEKFFFFLSEGFSDDALFFFSALHPAGVWRDFSRALRSKGLDVLL